MTRTRKLAGTLAGVVFVALVAGCSGSDGGGGDAARPSASAARTVPTSGSPADDLRTAAVTWAHSFLTGTLDDIHALQGPKCRSSAPSPLGPKALEGYLGALRAAMQHQFGRPLDQIAIRDVHERNVTNTSGEAEVEYELPEAVAGNDNWVTFRVHDGRWVVADCKAPIGGRTSSTTSG